MSIKILAIVGSYRKGGTVDSAVDAILEGARDKGAETHKIYLLDKHIEFCTNCRSCTQTPGPRRGKCVHNDDVESILSEIESADAIVLGAPVNFGNVTALFRRFMERLAVYAYWPWGQMAPASRNKIRTKRAALVTSSAMPGFLIPFSTGALNALKMAAKAIGLRPVATLGIGLSSRQRDQILAARTLSQAKKIGASLALTSHGLNLML